MSGEQPHEALAMANVGKTQHLDKVNSPRTFNNSNLQRNRYLNQSLPMLTVTPAKASNRKMESCRRFKVSLEQPVKKLRLHGVCGYGVSLMDVAGMFNIT